MTTLRRAVEIRLRSRPVGAATAADFELAETAIPVPGPGEVLVEVTYLSLDPALRPRMNAHSAYAGSIDLGEAIPSPALGLVIASNSPDLAPGDHVFGFLGWRTLAVAPADTLRRIEPEKAPLPKWLSLLGLSAFTAWVGLTEIGRPRTGETVLVSAASGATGSIAGQIATIMGARAVGIAGGPVKCRHVVENLGFAAAVDYRDPDFADRLAAACPDGIDVDFENVGGSVLRAAMARMNLYGRIVICGLVADYNSAGTWPDGPGLWPTVYKALRIEGFRASRYFDRIPAFVDQALAWSAEGRLRHYEHITEGIERAPQAFVAMLEGRHIGKAMVRI